MDTRIYPRKPWDESARHPLPDASVAKKIIQLREEGCTRVVSKLWVLTETDDTKTVNRIDAEIEQERLEWEGVDPCKFGTKDAFQAHLNAGRKWLSPLKFTDGVLDKHEVATWPQLKAKLAPVEMAR